MKRKIKRKLREGEYPHRQHRTKGRLHNPLSIRHKLRKEKLEKNE